MGIGLVFKCTLRVLGDMCMCMHMHMRICLCLNKLNYA